jgi:hypothetical protein
MPRVPGAYSPGLCWERLKTPVDHVVLTSQVFPPMALSTVCMSNELVIF